MVQIDQAKDVLLLVDIQNDFLPGGSLAVKEGDQIIPIVNKLQSKFQKIVATQDFHPPGHKSFAANHEGKKIGEMIQLDGLDQVLWPTHCVQGSFGSEFSDQLEQKNWLKIFRKGLNENVDSYSGFFDNARRGDTGLNTYLKEIGVQRVFVVGLALDYCVKFTALDSIDLGFDTFLITDGSRAVNLNKNDDQLAIEKMVAKGINIITSQEIE
ncbi:bifunctional nicotinamidase/pyrazinamidase [Algoriphagus sediminis]|uniref:nicotinamidase n=1 Tax=Algoriphagus sediminis TaxID=3057113 RepID=A0ABT7YE09_9BACT|nr:bifunctional nicotinamidase/pyrazinamidase [Algoriphagus sediminis]MDN3204600.1 bifunctional nicotinamidase/pyrazinamidase [Algoriphagus sediminis]